MTFNSLRAVKILEHAGVARNQAEAFAEIVSNAADTPDISDLATKADLEQLRLATKADLEQLRKDMDTSFEQLRKDVDTSFELVRKDMDTGFELVRKDFRADMAANTVRLILAVIAVSGVMNSILFFLLRH